MERGERRLRAEIQALRALAVGLVLLFHAWPQRLPGGFVGVDVFFVISGFLIGGGLAREAQRSGRVALAAFWARRARRILPAALLVLAVCSVATLAFVPETLWGQFFEEIRASALFFENWQLAGSATDYRAIDDPDSPVQHFWSLSVEEQLYLGWPLLVLGGWLVARRAGVVTAVAVVTAASFAYWVHATGGQPETAYFSTFGRAWEFGVGALLALAAARPRSPARAAALSWAGLAAIALAALRYDELEPFPGAPALLPVLGAAAVIAAGEPERAWAPTALMRQRPVQAVGDASYSIYLWHLPLLILVPIAGSATLGATEKTAVLAAALALGLLSKRFVEDPFRRAPALVRRRPRWTYAVAAAALLATLGVAQAGLAAHDARVRDSRALLTRVFEDPPRCFGAAALDPANAPCPASPLGATVVPSPAAPETTPEKSETRYRCTRDAGVDACSIDARPEGKGLTLAVIGDSHAATWGFAALAAGRSRGWNVIVIARPRCALLDVRPSSNAPWVAGCLRWRRDVPRWLRRHPEVTTVIAAQDRTHRVVPPAGVDGLELLVDGYGRAWRSLPASVRRIVTIMGPPVSRPESGTPACVARALGAGPDAVAACGIRREVALASVDTAAEAARRRLDPRVRAVDLTPYICPGATCPPVVGSVLVHADWTHLTTVYALTLGPYMARALDPLVE